MHILAGQRSTLCKKKKHLNNSTVPILRELFSKYGFSVHCVSDNGPQFRSEEFAHFLKTNVLSIYALHHITQPVTDWPKE